MNYPIIHTFRKYCNVLLICLFPIIAAFIIGLICFCIGCNSTLYPFGCLGHTSGKTSITSIDITNGNCYNPCYKMKINFDVCQPAIVGYSGSMTQASFILNNSNLHVGNTYDVYFYKIQPGRCIVVDFPIINNYGNSAYNDRFITEGLPAIGLAFLLVSTFLLIFSLIFTFKKCYKEYMYKNTVRRLDPIFILERVSAPNPETNSVSESISIT